VARPDTAPDADLVRRHLDGDPRAFERLVSRHRDRVYHLCLRMVGNPEDALDASQDAFVHAFRNLARFRGEAAFTTWLHRITVNACYDLLRRRRRQPVLHVVADDEGAPTEPGPSVPDHADEVAGTADAVTALASVPEEFRAALVLADVHDLPYEEIGRILEVPVGTVKSRVHRGRVALARAMGSREPTDGPSASKEER
jgi:RNA polymerase sigma-70 factor, ECF subfamily